MNKSLKNIGITLAVTICILIVLELVSRAILAKVYNRSFDSSLIEKNKYGPTDGLKANASGTVWGKPFHTDDMGGRKHKTKVGKRKLLIIGDSVTEGVGVEDSATFSYAIQNSDNYPDVRNLSMIGWSTNDYRNVIDSVLKKDKSIEDVYLFYCLNDIYGKASVKDLPPIANKGYASSINAFLQDRYATYKLIKLFTYQNSDHYYQYDQAMYDDTAKVNAAVADLVHIEHACNANLVLFKVFIVPYRSQLENRANNKPQRILINSLLRNQVRCIDLLYQWPKETDYSKLFLFADEIHLSPLGHREIRSASYDE